MTPSLARDRKKQWVIDSKWWGTASLNLHTWRHFVIYSWTSHVFATSSLPHTISIFHLLPPCKIYIFTYDSFGIHVDNIIAKWSKDDDELFVICMFQSLAVLRRCFPSVPPLALQSHPSYLSNQSHPSLHHHRLICRILKSSDQNYLHQREAAIPM